MKKNRYFLLLSVTVLITFFLKCKTVNNNQKIQLQIQTNATSLYPVDIQISDFFIYNSISKFIDTSHVKYNNYFIPGSRISINRDTSLLLFYPDTLNIEYKADKYTIRLSNSENIKYNLFDSKLRSKLSIIYNEASNYFFNKEDSIMQNEKFIDNYLTKYDSVITFYVDSLCARHLISKNVEAEILEAELKTHRISASYFYLLSSIPRMNKMGIMQSRLGNYINAIDQQKISVFSQHIIANLTNAIAKELMQQSISRVKDKTALQNYYTSMQQFFKKGTISYQYLVAALQVQIKKNRIKLNSSKLRLLKQDIRESIFTKYINSIYDSKIADGSDLPKDKSLYNIHSKSSEIKDLITSYYGKPVLIDFWATWCLPCLKKIPEINNYVSKFPKLNIVFISLDRSHDAWKRYLSKHDLSHFIHYRRNYKNQDEIFSQIQTIPKYGLLYKNGHIEILDEMNESILRQYYEQY